MRLASEPTEEIFLSINKIRININKFKLDLQPYAAEIIGLSTSRPQDLGKLLPGFPDKMVKLQKLGIHRPKESLPGPGDECYSFGKFPPSLESLQLNWTPLRPFTDNIDTLKKFTFIGNMTNLDTILEFMNKISSLERVELYLMNESTGSGYEFKHRPRTPVLEKFKSSLVVHCYHEEVIRYLISRISFSNGANLEIHPDLDRSIGLEYILSNVGDIAKLPTEVELDYVMRRIKLSGPNGSLSLYSVSPEELSSAREGKYPLSFEKTQELSIIPNCSHGQSRSGYSDRYLT